MSFDRIFNLLGMIVVLAIITTIVTRPESRRVIAALGNTFTGSIRAAMGR